MAIALRPYQLEAVQRVRLAFLEGHRAVLFVLPTGGGKTVVFCHIAQQAAERGKRIAVLVHRAELLEQASRSLAALGVRHGLIAAGRAMNLAAPVQVASVGTARESWVMRSATTASISAIRRRLAFAAQLPTPRRLQQHFWSRELLPPASMAHLM